MCSWGYEVLWHGRVDIRLALFLWQRPYFVEGLLQFASLHAKLGRPDQAMVSRVAEMQSGSTMNYYIPATFEMPP